MKHVRVYTLKLHSLDMLIPDPEIRVATAFCDNGCSISLVQGHTGPLVAAALSSDGTCAASASEDMTLRVWDVYTGKETGTQPCTAAGRDSLAFSADGRYLVAGCVDGSIQVRPPANRRS